MHRTQTFEVDRLCEVWECVCGQPRERPREVAGLPHCVGGRHTGEQQEDERDEGLLHHTEVQQLQRVPLLRFLCRIGEAGCRGAVVGSDGVVVLLEDALVFEILEQPQLHQGRRVAQLAHHQQDDERQASQLEATAAHPPLPHNDVPCHGFDPHERAEQRQRVRQPRTHARRGTRVDKVRHFSLAEASHRVGMVELQQRCLIVGVEGRRHGKDDQE
mmetsp:Transcript_12594/g.30051  ORF Transcript_12594/g.30051 Transcript_12594/m.30051 type:complete len:216 (-) Transcript_12594:796-1443(-)